MSTDLSVTRATDLITADWTVNAVLAKSPAARAILDIYNIDTCCGGRDSIGDAAAHADVDPALLLSLLGEIPNEIVQTTSVIPLPSSSCNCGCR